MKMCILTPGKPRLKGVDALMEHYKKLIGRHVALDIVYTRTASANMSPAAGKQKEGEELLRACPADYVKVAMDEHGKELTSVELAAHITKWQNASRKGIAFFIGGPDGLDDAVLSCADIKLALSRFTMPHDLARVILIEQLYRAYSIKAGHPYHRV